jgi:hypothetical protein
MGRRPMPAAPDLPIAAQRKSQIRKQNISEATPGGLNFGKFALERRVLAFCRLSVTNGLALLPATY